MDDTAIKQALAGCKPTQRKLIMHLQDIWFRFCVSLLADSDLAKDATQETAMRFLRSLKKFNHQSTITTWSLGIALNVCRELRRKRKKHYNKPLTMAEEPSHRSTPDHIAEQQELITQIKRLLSDLPDRQREVISLRYLQNLSVQDTATTLGIAAGTVKATLSQALAKLRKQMESKP
ncbi:RNA polymerase sigma factor [Poriferisphaera sp. WC338]|uniref:RNA polymerase sigma factor n=1 Tax=Poriferisphaera sp. WC338 TaxID=3425129 RepID=UPI003D813E6B